MQAGTTLFIHYKFKRLERIRVHRLCSPDILANTLDPMTELIDTRIPILQAIPHAINLLHIQHFGLHPVDVRHLRDLVDRPLQQTQRQRLHNQMLNLVGLHLGLGGDISEGEGAVMRRAAEDHLRQRGERNLLVEEHAVRFEQLVLADVARKHVVCSQVAPVEGEEQVAQPVVWCLGQGIQDGVQEELAEVVD